MWSLLRIKLCRLHHYHLLLKMMAKTKIQKCWVLHFAFITRGKKDFVTAFSESIFMFRNSGSELLPTVLSAAALQPSAVPDGCFQ